MPPEGDVLGLSVTRSLPPPPESSSSSGVHVDAPSERRNMRNRAPPRTRATRWRTPKITSNSASGDIAHGIPPRPRPQTAFRYHRRPLVASTFSCLRRPIIMPDSTKLSLTARAPEGSRSARRLRRSGEVPGVIYGGDGDPSPFSVDGRILRNTLAHSGAILDVTIDGGTTSPVLVKDVQRHPVRGEIVHVDLLRVNMNETIQTTVVLELIGADDSPGVSEGGVLSQETREVNIEALPGDIPDVITHDVSGMEMNATLTLSAVTAPQGVTLLDDPEETVVATITPPTLEPVEDEIETETGLVGEDGEPVSEEEAEAAKAEAEGDTAEEASQKADSDES